MQTILIRNGQIVNRGKIFEGDMLIKNQRIEKIAKEIDAGELRIDHEIDATGKFVIPGIIDDQVHFREPGLTHKATIASESRAAVAGGVTSYMEMPNTMPPTITQPLLDHKYRMGAMSSLANYSFYIGATNDNLENILETDFKNVCGIKIFMGSSTGNMLVDNTEALENIFKEAPALIATHCEDEKTIRDNLNVYRLRYGNNCLPAHHAAIRSEHACLLSSSLAVKLAQRYNTRLHVLHLSTEIELPLFKNNIPLAEKRITAEVCVHHLYFNSNQYKVLGNKIKCNPAIKNKKDQLALFDALLDDRLDVIATDHAPHTLEEKSQIYLDAPSGLPLVQHGLAMMLKFYHENKISIEKIVEKMCHAPAICFQVEKRGFLDEGYWGDVAIVDVNQRFRVKRENIYYQCKWSPLEAIPMTGLVETTIVSGHLAYHNGDFFDYKKGERMTFER
ncbi:MAG: hypothetical protein RL757_3 [Bacteroidota bacterium]|jgi:dihydroorotase